jgi:phage terminase large subunit-like protein
MAPATDLAYAMISEGRMSHNGDERLCRHVRNCVVRPTVAGDMIGKDHKSSPRKVDAAIAMIIALARASHYATQPVKRRRVWVGSYQ